MIDIYPNLLFSIFENNYSTDELQEIIVNRLEKNFKSKVSITRKNESSGIVFRDWEKRNILEYKGILFDQENKNVIYSDNTGECYYSLIRNICLNEQISAVHCRIYLDKQYPGFFLSKFDDSGNERLIQCYKDERGWTFFEKGPVQDFENIDYYKRKTKKERFNENVIKEYLYKLGLNFLEDSFWEPVDKVCYISRTTK